MRNPYILNRRGELIERMTEGQAEKHCRELWGEDWWFHLQMMRLEGRIIEEHYDPQEDRY